MQVNLNDEREAIARIIDPAEWRLHDQARAKGMENIFVDWSLTKADAIINHLRTKEPSRG